jgi:hypothetical protein
MGVSLSKNGPLVRGLAGKNGCTFPYYIISDKNTQLLPMGVLCSNFRDCALLEDMLNAPYQSSGIQAKFLKQ